MKTNKSPAGYTLEGKTIGSCGCSVALDCLCWGQEPGGKSCDSFVAYHIDQGVIADIDVSSLTVVRILRQHDQTTLLYVDGNGNEQQQHLLIQAFTGELGGILHTIHQSFLNHGVARIAPITYAVERKQANLWISNILVRKNMQQTPFCFSV